MQSKGPTLHFWWIAPGRHWWRKLTDWLLGRWVKAANAEPHSPCLAVPLRVGGYVFLQVPEGAVLPLATILMRAVMERNVWSEEEVMQHIRVEMQLGDVQRPAGGLGDLE
jgi:hypothetical protein